jgi:hypothetical protein
MNRPPATLAAVALLFCFVGIAGLFLPLVDIHLGLDPVKPLNGVRETVNTIDTSVGGLPFLGLLMVVAFVGLTALPALDLVTGRVHWTRWLAVPAGIMLLPMLLFAAAALWFGLKAAWFAGFVGERVAYVEVGAGAVFLIIAEFGLAGVSFAAIAASRGRARTPSLDPAPAPRRRDDRDPNL